MPTELALMSPGEIAAGRKLPDSFRVVVDDDSLRFSSAEKLHDLILQWHRVKAELLKRGYIICEYRDEAAMRNVADCRLMLIDL